MATVSYITPITNRTNADVAYAKANQADLENKHKGAWNYTDANRVCNNLKYAAEHMYEQGFLSQPYSMTIKTDWVETDIITYEQLNTMIVDNMNNLKTYSRPDLTWYPVASIANMDYNVANWLEKNIDALATQVPMPPDTYVLNVKKGSGSGIYEANTVVTIQADPPGVGEVFSHWSGDHLENIDNATAMITTYKMPHQDITLEAIYTSTVPHTLKVITYTKTETTSLLLGEVKYIEADPAPQGKVFHHWDVTPSQYDGNLYEPAATTHFTMPNEDVTLSAFYITKGQKYLKVTNGTGTGYYDYGTYVAVAPSLPSNATFTGWSGDTQYLTGSVTQAYNSVLIPDVSTITIRANYTTPPTPPVTNVRLTVVNGVITNTGETTGYYTQGDKVSITANPVPSGDKFTGWTRSGGGSVTNSSSLTATVTIGTTATTMTANYRTLEYYTLTVTTNSGTTTSTKERYDYFSIDAGTAPDGQTFSHWSGNTSGLDVNDPTTGTTMGAGNRTITAVYRSIGTHTLTVKQLSGDVIYEQAEFSKATITADAAPDGQRFVRWSRSGSGSLSSTTSRTTTFTFGNGDTTLTPVYVNIWTITVIGGTINGSTSAVLDQGTQYTLRATGITSTQKFEGWTKTGPGTITNTASSYTYFTVGAGDATITANVSNYPAKTITIYMRDPDTGEDTLVSSNSYTYNSKVTIEAPIAPDKTTFLSWLGDTSYLSPSALASSVTINNITADITITATYFYPEAPQYYNLTVHNGYPDSGSYAAGTQVAITAKTPNAGWEFYKWYGDIEYLVNPDVTQPENSVIMPLKSISLYAKFKVIGELPLYRVSVVNGTASGTYYTDDGETEHNESGVFIDVPAGTQVTLTADPDVVGWVFDYWDGNFDAAGVADIVKTNNPTLFTMTEHDLNITMVRRELEKYTVYTTNATGPGQNYPGTYTIAGNLYDTEDKKYTFEQWTCVDADGNDCIDAIEDPTSVETEITLTDKDLWIEAVYTTHYKLTVILGQDTGDGYYYEGETVDTVYANTPSAEENVSFDHWEDPVGITVNKYDPTPTIIMKNTVATITAVFTSKDTQGNSVIMTGADIDDSLILRSDSYLVNGQYAVGAVVFDRHGCLGVLTQVDPDNTDDTDDYQVEKLFYGGNF